MSCLSKLGAVLAFTLLAGAASASTSCVVPPNANELATAIAQGLNANRVANNLRPLNYNPKLGQAAMTQACDMTVRNFFGHDGSDGSNVQNRARRAGYRDCLIAENLAWGYPRPEQIINGWMNSPGHRHNMLLPRVSEFGVAIAQGAQGPYWVLVLARGC
jgi:uncharacterized protein YkwD